MLDLTRQEKQDCLDALVSVPLAMRDPRHDRYHILAAKLATELRSKKEAPCKTESELESQQH